MKASLKLLVATIAFAIVANVALANVDKAKDEKNMNVTAQIYANDEQMIFVQLEKAGKGNVTIKIYDQEGQILHTESVKDEIKVLKRFDVSNLPSGTYVYEVSSSNYTLRKEIAKE